MSHNGMFFTFKTAIFQDQSEQDKWFFCTKLYFASLKSRYIITQGNLVSRAIQIQDSPLPWNNKSPNCSFAFVESSLNDFSKFPLSARQSVLVGLWFLRHSEDPGSNRVWVAFQRVHFRILQRWKWKIPCVHAECCCKSCNGHVMLR